MREAVLHELAEVGYGAFTIDSVANRSGVARSTIYRHWPDKVTLIADSFDTLNQQPRPRDVPGGESPRQRIQQLLRHLAEVFQESIFSACIPALIEGAERNPELRDFLHQQSDRRRQALIDAIAAGVAAGEISPRVDPDLGALALSGAIIYRRIMTGERFDPKRVGDLIDTVLGEPTTRIQADRSD